MFESLLKPELQFKTLTGSIVTFNSQYAGLPLKSCVVDFEDETGIDSLDFSATGLNLWGGKGMLNSFIRENPAQLTYNDEKLSFYRTDTSPFVQGIFKPLTQYTIILSGYKESGNSTYTNIKIEYTDGTSSNLIFPISELNLKQQLIFITASDKTVRDIKGSPYSGTTVLFYNECALLEGVKTADDFVPFRDNKLFSFGKTVQNGSLNVLTGVLINNDTTPPEVINLGGMVISTLQGENNLFASTGDTTLQYPKFG